MVVALIIIALLSFFFLPFRAYCSFSLIMIGAGAFIAGLLRPEELFVTWGAAMFVTGILIILLTSFKAVKSKRLAYMGRLFVYGMFLFLRIMLIMMIITIPIAAACAQGAANYRELIVVDCYGRDTGRRVTVDTNTMKDSSGKEYDKYDPY